MQVGRGEEWALFLEGEEKRLGDVEEVVVRQRVEVTVAA